MDIAALHALTWTLNRAVHGVETTVTLTGEAPILTRGIWVAPVAETFPAPEELARREPVRVMALGRDEVPRLPRGTLIAAAESSGGAVLRWTVDGTEREAPDHVRVYLVPAPAEVEES